MPFNKNTSDLHNDAYWMQIDKLHAHAEEKNLIKAIRKTDTEKFHAFTSMLRISNTLNKIMVLPKK